MSSSPRRHPRITFLLGKAVRSDTIFPHVIDTLRALPATVDVHVVGSGGSVPDSICKADLVVQRGLSRPTLLQAQQLEQMGVRFCNRVGATIAVTDRAWLACTLADVGLPVPATRAVDNWPDVLKLADGNPTVVKAIDGSVGRGRGVLVAEHGVLPEAPPFDGPYVVQEYIGGDGRVFKIYVAGSEMRGSIKATASPISATPLQIEPAIERVARLAGQALGLQIFGVDLLIDGDAFIIVDVNPFPGFRSVPDGANLVARCLTRQAQQATAPLLND